MIEIIYIRTLIPKYRVVSRTNHMGAVKTYRHEKQGLVVRYIITQDRVVCTDTGQ